MKRIRFFNNEYYHIYNRGVEKRDIYLDQSDFYRFLKSLYEFNIVDGEGSAPLVSVVCYCLMPNHFHLLLQQKNDGGISKFIQKVSTGYTMYFNKRYERSGVLFQGKFKAKHIGENQYLLHLSKYIHLNPFEILSSGEGKDMFEKVFNYRWSSLSYYLDQNKPSMVNLDKDIILGQFTSRDDFRRAIKDHAKLNLGILEAIKID